MSEEKKSALHPYLARFCEVTPIHGFGFVGHSWKVSEYITWTVVILASVALLVRDIVLLVETYMSEPTSTEISVQHNFSMMFPSPAFCIEFNRGFLPITGIQNSSDVQNQLAADYNASTNNMPILNKTAANYANELLNITDATLFLTYAMLADIRDHTLAAALGAPPYPMTWGQYRLPQSIAGPAASSILSAVWQFYIAAGVDFVELSRNIAALICVKAGTILKYESASLTTTVAPFKLYNACVKSMYIGMGAAPGLSTNDVVCLQTNQTLFTHPGDALYISAELSGIYGANTTGYCMPPANINDNGSTSIGEVFIYVDLFNGEGIFDCSRRDGVFAAKCGTTVSAAINVVGEFNCYNSNHKPCYATQTNAECRHQCLGAYTLSTCGCWPFNYASEYAGSGSVPLCGTTNASTSVTGGSQYVMPISACFANMFSTSIANSTYWSCFYGCRDKCDRWSYDYDPTLRDINMTATTVKLFNTRYVYITLTEYLAMDGQAFIASFGGSMGIWLGASLMAFVHIPIFLLTMLFERCTSKRKRVSTRRVSTAQEKVVRAAYDAPEPAAFAPPQPTY